MQSINLLEFESLVDKWIADTLSPSELLKLHEYLREDSYRALFEESVAKAYAHAPIVDFEGRSWESIINSIKQQGNTKKQIVFRKLRVWVAAAVLLIIVGVSFWLNMDKQTPSFGNNPLEQLSSGIIIQDSKGGKTTWSDETHSQHVYQDLIMLGDTLNIVQTTEEVIFYSIDNPRGGSAIDIKLADGSVATLHAGSSIHFPNRFTEKYRAVKMDGELYFKVKHDLDHPFVVQSKEIQVRVLGTSFNVKAYEEDDHIETTLVEGKVYISDAKGNGLLLKPGEQAIYQSSNSSLSKRPVDIDHVVAWREGLLIMDNESLKNVLRKIERVYNVDCVFEDNYKDIKIWGTLSTKDKLTDLLPMLEKVSGVKLRLEKSKLYINQ